MPAPRSARPSLPEIISVRADVDEVACDGGGALGHPLVYFRFEGTDEVTCSYCGRRFVKDGPI